mgnify:FL=1
MELNNKDGYITDYISGTQVKATPEELDAVQVFAKQLVEDYGYPKHFIQTRPQYRVKASPSDTSKTYPVDIIVFSAEQHIENNEYIIVECKKKTRKDGQTQLQDYLRLSRATIGVWFNGKERIFLKKIEHNGKVIFDTIPNIPRYGQRLEDMGQFLRRDLQPTHNLKIIFNSIRCYLAGNAVGTTMDQTIAQQIINIIFCKIYDERFTEPDEPVSFRVGIDEDTKLIKQRIDELFVKVKTKYTEVIEIADKISLDSDSLVYVVGELQNYCLIEAERDVIADAFETFIQYTLKGSLGQFFTPRNIVRLIVEIVKPQPNEILIDPACGSGGFLIESMKYMWNVLAEQDKKYHWGTPSLIEEQKSCAIKSIRGIEKDAFLAKVTKAYMAILGDGKSGIFCEDALAKPTDWAIPTQQSVGMNRFDVLLANPPFGKDIKVAGEDKLGQYDLAHNWKSIDNGFEMQPSLKKEENIQIIYVERCLKLLREGGRLGLIMPETYFHAPRTKYILNYLTDNNNITWLIDLPHNTFRPHNNAKCIVVILEKGKKQQAYINMAVAEQMGHDHQGKEMYRWNYATNAVDKKQIWDDIPLILNEFHNNNFVKYCFQVSSRQVLSKGILVPRYYWQNRLNEIQTIAASQNLTLIPISTLIKEGVISYFDGHGSPEAETKGKGEIPYIRVKDIVNWEIYKDPTSKIPKEVYLALKQTGKKDLQVGDIAYVRRGSSRIGSVAMVSPFDIEALYTREILILRVNPNNKYGLTPYYLLYLLSHRLTQMQASNKILIETTLPNIADRWQELELPVDNDKQKIIDISNRIKSVMDNKWNAIEQIHKLCTDLGDLTT